MIVSLLGSAAITGALGDIGTAAVLVGLVAPTSEVYRDGELVELESKSLVVGDVV